jgi:hypothetical protein
MRKNETTMKRQPFTGRAPALVIPALCLLMNTLAYATTTVWNVNIGWEVTTSDNYVGAAPENTQNSTWNSINSITVPALLADSTGSTNAGVIFEVTAPTLPTIGNNMTSTGDEIFRTWMKASGNTVDFTCTFSNLTVGATYDLVIYADWYWQGGAIAITQAAGTGLAGSFVLNYGSPAQNDVGPLKEDTNPANVSTNNCNFARFRGLLPDSSGNLAFLVDGGNWPVSGFQLVKVDLADSTPPTPDPMTFAILPAAAGESSITMTASNASDSSGVEYLFTETSGNPGATSSDWQNSPVYTDTGLTPSTTYTYTVKARDKSVAQNQTAASAPASATTLEPDTTAPTPSPMSFATSPTNLSITKITMTATTASDPHGVQYFFTCTAGGGHNSGWQDSPVYTDTGLTPSTAYTYTVKARDKSLALNMGTESSPATATTQTPLPGEIVWSLPQNTTSAADVLKTGQLIMARHGDQYAGTITVNGVDFSPGPILGEGGEYSSANCLSSCPDELETLLDRFSWGYTPASFQITGLTPGAKYVIQVFFTDQRSPSYNRSFGDNAGNYVTLASGGPTDTTTYGQFATGTFTAKANGTQTVETSLINAYQIRKPHPPGTLMSFY